MAKKPELVIVNDDDGGVTLTPARAKPLSAKEALNPIDPDTGESTFDDLDSRFATPAPRMGSPSDQDEDEDSETDAELDELFPKDKKPKKKSKAADEDEDEDELGAEDEQPDEPEVEETPDEPEDEDEDEEEEPAPRGGKGIQGRINRERRLRDELRQDNDDLRVRLDQMEQTINTRASDETYASTKSDLSTKIEAKRAELVAAKEAGNTTDEVRLIEELSDLKADLRTATNQYDNAKAERERRKTTANSIVARKVTQWKRRTPKFDEDAEFGGFALAVDRALMAEGRLNPETDEYYKELDRRIAKRFPEAYKGRDLSPRGEKPRNKHPSLGQRNEGGGKRPLKKQGEFERGKDGRVKLSRMHVNTMRQFNLDPDDPNDVREFISNNS